MTPQEELASLRRLAELEARAKATTPPTEVFNPVKEAGSALVDSAKTFGHRLAYGVANIPLLPATMLHLAFKGIDALDEKFTPEERAARLAKGSKPFAEGVASGPQILKQAGFNPPPEAKIGADRVQQLVADALSGSAGTKMVAPLLGAGPNLLSNFGGATGGQIAGHLTDDNPVATIPAALAGGLPGAVASLRKPKLEHLLQEGVETLGEQGLRDAATRRATTQAVLGDIPVAINQGAKAPSQLDAVLGELLRSPVTGSEAAGAINKQLPAAVQATRGFVEAQAPGRAVDTTMAGTIRDAVVGALQRPIEAANSATKQMYRVAGRGMIDDVDRVRAGRELPAIPKEAGFVPGSEGYPTANLPTALLRPEEMKRSEYFKLLGAPDPNAPYRGDPSMIATVLTKEAKPIILLRRELNTAINGANAEGATAGAINAGQGAKPAMKALDDILRKNVPEYGAAQDLQTRYRTMAERLREGPLGRMTPQGKDALDDPGKLAQLTWVFGPEAGPKDVALVADRMARSSPTLPGVPNAFSQLVKADLTKKLEAATGTKATTDAAQKIPEALASNVFGAADSRRRQNLETAIGKIAEQREASPQAAVDGFRNLTTALETVSRGRSEVGSLSNTAIQASREHLLSVFFPSTPRRMLERYTQGQVYREALDAMFASDGVDKLIKLAETAGRNRVPEALATTAAQPALQLTKD
jgi:hypothetical protein